MECHRFDRRWLRLPAFLALGLAWFAGGVMFEKTLSMRRILPLAGPGPAALVRAGQARQPVRLLADFESKSAVLLGANEMITCHPRLFGDLAEALQGELAIGLVADAGQEQAARDLLVRRGLPADAMRFLRLPLNTMWLRDYGPMFVRGEEGLVMAVDAEYRGPGGRSDRWRDDALPQHLARMLGIPVRQLPLRLDGGNLLANGDGLAVATTRLLEENLGDGVEMRDVRVAMARQLGLRQLSLVDPLAGEETGHADMFLVFLAPDLALVGQCDPGLDPGNAATLDHTAGVLEGTPTSLGPLRVRRIPLLGMPDGSWRSYCNVILTDRKVLVPVFSDVDPVTQEHALAVYRELSPGREVVPVQADSLSYCGGFLHCVSISLPGGMDVAASLGER